VVGGIGGGRVVVGGAVVGGVVAGGGAACVRLGGDVDVGGGVGFGFGDCVDMLSRVCAARAVVVVTVAVGTSLMVAGLAD
jgi:hypothetical protein